MKKLLILLVVLLIAAGCSKKVVKPEAKLETSPDRKEAKTVEPSELIDEKLSDKNLSKVKPAESANALSENKDVVFSDVFFDYDSYDLRSDSVSALASLSNYLVKTKSRVVIEGHCDERGTNEYNLALSDRRAVVVQRYLVSSGVPLWRLQAVSYGEEKPQCFERDETCWSLNRRAHPVILGDNNK